MRSLRYVPIATSLTLGVAASLTLAASPVEGQKLDRTKQPVPAAAPEIRVPSWNRTRLSNGAELIVSQKRDLPLVAFNINFIGGSYAYEPAAKLGTASFTAQMLSEGTPTRTAEQIADEQQMLGTQITGFVGGESGSLGFTALRDRFEPALALLADVLVNPTFPEAALERIRGRTLVSLAQAKEQPNAIASNVFSRTLYGAEHPYGRVTTEQTVKAVTRDDVVAFHRAYYRPGRAVITVTGDVEPNAVKAAVEKALARWPAGGEKPSWDYPALPAAKATTIYLVDKPKSAQSVFSIGLPGPPRDTPDYYALAVMNHILGGLFQSRINHNIREEKGWSYGVGSGFSYGRGPGAFEAGGGIVTAKTDSALMEFMKELQGAQGEKPFTEDEVKQGKESLIQSLPRRFASVNGIGSAIGSLYVQGLPESYYKEYAAKINAVTPADLERVAKKYIDLGKLNIVIVGDRAVIEEPLKKTGIAPVVILDVEGKAAGVVP